MNAQAPIPHVWPDVERARADHAQQPCPELEFGYLAPQLLGSPSVRCLSSAESGSTAPGPAMPLSFS